ncbi:MAG: hypothetical protein GXX82_00440 [Syntrophorhabdus sp.]|nr:hypothetical protein [Syntrophorhabdus sp.]
MKQAFAVIACMAFVLLLCRPAGAAGYTYAVLDYPGATHTEAWDINNSGVVVGWYDTDSDSFSEPHGFVLYGTTWYRLDHPGAMWTFAMGINDGGTLVGTWVDPGGVAFGFSLTGGGYAHIDPYPSADESYVYSINNANTIVGWFSGDRPEVPAGLSGYYGYSLSGGVYTFLDYPAGPGVIFHAYGINDSDAIVGQCVDFEGTHCCSLSGDTLSFLDRPGADFAVAWGVNNGGAIVGEYSDATGTHGFLLDGATWATLDYPGALETVAHGINDSGVIVGYFTDHSGTHGFVATPATDLMSVAIDIRPWSGRNLINVRGWDFVPVAILSSPTFDAFEMTDPGSLTFGHTGNETSMVFCSPWAWDVNYDGYADLLCLFRTGTAGFQCGDTRGVLKGKTGDGTPFEGKGTVRVYPCRTASR